jgi:hypothetical protein
VDDLTVAAHHEAGHAVMAVLVGAQIRSVELRGDCTGLTRCRHLDPAVGTRIRKTLAVSLGGPIAESLLLGCAPIEVLRRDSSRGDLLTLREIDRRCPSLLRRVYPETKDLVLSGLRERWGGVAAVATALMRRGSLAEADVRGLLRR